MAYRFTNTDKWGDSWFASLKPEEKLLFLYLCDNCDIAGFIELNIKRWEVDLNLKFTSIQAALKGLERGLKCSSDGSCIFVRNFIKHQKNLPLNKNNKAHLGIINRFSLYQHKFKFTSIDSFLSEVEAPLTPLLSPTGISNMVVTDLDNDLSKESNIEYNSEISKKNRKPTLFEVNDYCFERNKGVDPNKFFNYYESNGWMVGKNKMKDWKAAVRTWESNSYKPPQNGNQPPLSKLDNALNI